MRRVAGIAMVALLLGSCSDPPPERGYDGTWVMTLGPRVFAVLTLERVNGEAQGTLTMPEHNTSADGRTFAGISGAPTSKKLIKAMLSETHLRLTFEDLAAPGEPDEFDMTLFGENEATLKIPDIPVDISLPLKRQPGRETPVVATDWDPTALYSVDERPAVASKEMAAIYDEDQAARPINIATMADAQIEALAQGDAGRRKRTRALLDAGTIQTGLDYRKAAFIFQHGDTPDDYLLAHTLAIIAMKKGDTSASFIAVATLDRYLNSIKKPQIYGSQFSMTAKPPPPTSPLITDALRRELGVPVLSNTGTTATTGTK